MHLFLTHQKSFRGGEINQRLFCLYYIRSLIDLFIPLMDFSFRSLDRSCFSGQRISLPLGILEFLNLNFKVDLHVLSFFDLGLINNLSIYLHLLLWFLVFKSRLILRKDCFFSGYSRGRNLKRINLYLLIKLAGWPLGRVSDQIWSLSYLIQQENFGRLSRVEAFHIEKCFNEVFSRILLRSLSPFYTSGEKHEISQYLWLLEGKGYDAIGLSW